MRVKVCIDLTLLMWSNIEKQDDQLCKEFRVVHYSHAPNVQVFGLCEWLSQVVVGEVDSLVMVWNLDTGEDVFTFSDTHRSQIKLWFLIHLKGIIP